MDRALTPVVGVVLLIAITVVGAAVVAGFATGLDVGPAPAPTASLSASADSDAQRIAVVHRGGQALDMREVTLRITVDGEPLAHQPPVPYFAAVGFRGTPTGPFNSGGDPVLSAGERASLQLASTNAPHFDPGDEVTVAVARDGQRVVAATVVAS